MCIRRFDREGHSHLFTLDARYADIGVAQSSVEIPSGLGGRAYKGRDVDGPCHYGLTADSTEAERPELITIILNVAAAMHHIFRCIHNIGSASICERLEHELGTNRRNNEEERRRKRLRYRRKRASYFGRLAVE